MDWESVDEQDRDCIESNERGLPCLKHATFTIKFPDRMDIDLCDDHYLELKVLLQNH